jgi:hypothetical protein
MKMNWRPAFRPESLGFLENRLALSQMDGILARLGNSTAMASGMRRVG